MATVTFTVQAPMQAKFGPNRNWNIAQSIVTTATWSAGDVYLFNNIKIPHGAVVTNVEMKGSVVDGTCLIEMGMYGSNATADIFGSVTLSATAVMTSVRTTGIPHTISVSDDAALRYQTFGVRVDGAGTSATTSVSINVIVKYYTR